MVLPPAIGSFRHFAELGAHVLKFPSQPTSGDGHAAVGDSGEPFLSRQRFAARTKVTFIAGELVNLFREVGCVNIAFVCH